MVGLLVVYVFQLEASPSSEGLVVVRVVVFFFFYFFSCLLYSLIYLLHVHSVVPFGKYL